MLTLTFWPKRTLAASRSGTCLQAKWIHPHNVDDRRTRSQISPTLARFMHTIPSGGVNSGVGQLLPGERVRNDAAPMPGCESLDCVHDTGSPRFVTRGVNVSNSRRATIPCCTISLRVQRPPGFIKHGLRLANRLSLRLDRVVFAIRRAPRARLSQRRLPIARNCNRSVRSAQPFARA
jgi:hypothetical protein